MNAFTFIPERFRRQVVVGGGIALALLIELIIVNKVIPGSGSGSRGAPTPILFLALVYGLVNSLTAVGIVLIYRSIRVINFAQTAIGAAGFALTYNFIVLTKVPFPIALALGLVIAAGVGLLVDLVLVRRFFHAPRLVLTVFTIIAASFVASTARNAVDSLPIFPEKADRPVAAISGTADIPKLLPFSHFHFRLPGTDIPFGFIHLFAIGMTLLTLVGIAYFLRSTRLGVAVRALAENSERAALLGISVGFISSVVWAMSGFLSGMGSTLNGLLGGRASFGFNPTLLLPALAAAVLAQMTSIPIAVAASVGIELFSRSISFLQPDYASITTGVLLAVIAAGLLLQRRRGGRSEQVTGTWEAGAEVRATPTELAKLPLIRVVKWVLILLVVAGIVVFPFISSKGQVYLGSVVAIQAIVALSIVVLTGWTGQVSLGQFAFAAVGAVVTGAVTAHTPFWLAIPIGTVVAAGLAVLIGLPALRLPGLYLAIATFAFAAAVHDLLFNEKLFGWLLPNDALRRPTLPFLNFEDERSMYFFVIIGLGLCLLVVRNLRRSRFGRILIGLRENEANAESAGIAPLRMKLTAFAIAGALAGFGGALLAFQQRGVGAQSFGAETSVDVFVLSMLGGLGSIIGPLLGAGVINALKTSLAGFPEISDGIAPLMSIVILYIEPGGLIAIATRVRDAVLRIVAQRNQLVVPSLFADVDPESMHLRLIPISSTSDVGSARVSARYDRTSMHSDLRRATGHEDHALAAAATAIEVDE